MNLISYTCAVNRSPLSISIGWDFVVVNMADSTTVSDSMKTYSKNYIPPHRTISLNYGHMHVQQSPHNANAISYVTFDHIEYDPGK